MNIGEEKEHVYQLMRNVIEERRLLTEMYYGLKERLDELNKLESQGIEDLSVKGYVDLYNRLDKRLGLNNLEREAEYAMSKLNQLVEEKRAEVEKPIQEEQVKKSVIPDFEIAESKFKENKKAISKPAEKEENNIDAEKPFVKVSHKKKVELIEKILKDAGRPMKLREIYDYLTIKYGLDIAYNGFQTNTMYRIGKDLNNCIERASAGYYQYNKNKKFNVEENKEEDKEDEPEQLEVYDAVEGL